MLSETSLEVMGVTSKSQLKHKGLGCTGGIPPALQLPLGKDSWQGKQSHWQQDSTMEISVFEKNKTY
jgi:hypothetical protein